MTRDLVAWADLFAEFLEANSSASSLTVVFETGGRLNVDRVLGAKFLARGEVLDIEDAVAQEGYEQAVCLPVAHPYEGEV